MKELEISDFLDIELRDVKSLPPGHRTLVGLIRRVARGDDQETCPECGARVHGEAALALVAMGVCRDCAGLH